MVQTRMSVIVGYRPGCGLIVSARETPQPSLPTRRLAQKMQAPPITHPAGLKVGYSLASVFIKFNCVKESAHLSSTRTHLDPKLGGKRGRQPGFAAPFYTASYFPHGVYLDRAQHPTADHL